MIIENSKRECLKLFRDFTKLTLFSQLVERIYGMNGYYLLLTDSFPYSRRSMIINRLNYFQFTFAHLILSNIHI